MSAKKKSNPFRPLISLLLLVTVVLVGLYLSGSFLLAKALEAAIGAPVKIEKFKLDFFSSQIGIDGLRVLNPKGFQEPTLASIPEIFIHVDLPSIFKRELHIHEIRLNLDEITVERNPQGAVNLMEIGAVKGPRFARPPARGMKPRAGTASDTPGKPGVSSAVKKRPRPSAEPAPQAQKPPQRTEAPPVVIDRVVLSLGRARYIDGGVGPASLKTFSLNIKQAVIRNVTDPRQITQQIVFKTLQKVGFSALTQQFSGLGLNWQEGSLGASDQLRQAWDGMKEKFKFSSE